jgi:carboxylesterase
MPDAEPYFGGSGPLGVLVIHGFTGSPRSMLPWARHLEADGFRVALPRLPGHGTSWQEMNQTRWEDWYAGAEAAFEDLRGTCEQVFLAGLSMGGGLALLLAARRGKQVSGLSLVNPSVHARDPRKYVAPVLRLLTSSLATIGSDIAMPDVVEGAYERTPVHAAWSFTKLWKETQSALGSVDQPLLIFKSRVDHTVGPSSLKLIRRRVRSTDVQIVTLERSYHVATLDYDANLIFTGSSAFFSRLASRQS